MLCGVLGGNHPKVDEKSGSVLRDGSGLQRAAEGFQHPPLYLGTPEEHPLVVSHSKHLERAPDVLLPFAFATQRAESHTVMEMNQPTFDDEKHRFRRKPFEEPECF